MRSRTTFTTPWGNFRPRRLVFGAKSSQDVLDEVMFKVFGDIPNSINQRDDVLIGGKDEAEHGEMLKKVLQ